MIPAARFSLMAILLGICSSGHAIVLGMVDDFESPPSCARDGWIEGPGSSNPPEAMSSCGAGGSCCLANASAGGFGPGSRQVTLNESQWTGDYLFAGVNKIQFEVANPGATTLNIRVGVTDGTTCYVSTDAAVIAPGAALATHAHLLADSEMTLVPGTTCGGDADLSSVLANVTQLRIVSSTAPAWSGDAIVSEVHLDNVQALADSDLDGVNDDLDNCTLVPNPGQTDTDGDGYGNRCDPDLNNNCRIDFADLGLMRSVFFTADPDADLDVSGSVNFSDLMIMRQFFFMEPGPGLGVCGACEPPVPTGDNADFAGLEVFARGAMALDWGAVSGINSFSDTGGGLYTARFEMPSGSFEYKIADEGWSLEYCSGTTQVQGVTNNLPLFGCAFPTNGVIEVPAPDCYEFTMQTDGSVPPNAVELTFDVVP